VEATVTKSEIVIYCHGDYGESMIIRERTLTSTYEVLSITNILCQWRRIQEKLYIVNWLVTEVLINVSLECGS